MPQTPDAGAAPPTPSDAGPASPSDPGTTAPAPSDVLTPLDPGREAPDPRTAEPRLRLLLALLPAAFATLVATRTLPGVGTPDGQWYALNIAGCVLGLWLPALVLRLLARPAGLAPLRVSVGAGHWGGSTVRRGRLVVFRQIPVPLPFWTLALTAWPVPLGRLRAAAAFSLLVPAGCAAALMAAGGTPTAVGSGCALGVAFVLVAGFAAPGSLVSTLFRGRSGGPGAHLAEVRHGPAELAAARALAAGRVEAAREALAEPCPEPGSTRRLMDATLALAEGRVEDAARDTLRLFRQARHPGRRAAVLRIHAQALADGMAAGVWTAEEARPAFDAALATLRRLAPATLKQSELPAVQAALRGRTHDAVALATRAAVIAPEAFSRARAQAVRAEALAAAGDMEEARNALSRAQRLAPALARTRQAAATLPTP